MKQLLKTLLPRPLSGGITTLRRRWQSGRDARRSRAEVFAEIYRRGSWGRAPEGFCSGTGSVDEAIVGPYVEAVARELRAFGPHKPVLVDLGCGDFRLGRCFVELASRYVGVDVVPELIAHLAATAAAPGVSFQCLDLCTDPLPAGDVAFLRQVLQHLSNAEIAAILPKLRQYRAVYITEHLPSPGPGVVPNLDKVHGGTIRLARRSGVFLDQPPFNLDPSRLALVLEVPGHPLDDGADPGIIRTVKLR